MIGNAHPTPPKHVLDWAAPFVATTHDTPHTPIIGGGRHLAVIVAAEATTVVGTFGSVAVDQNQVVILAPATPYRIEQRPGQNTWAAFVHERLAVDVLQWRHRTAGGKVDVWHHLRSRTPPYWRGTVERTDHAALLAAIVRSTSEGSASLDVWDRLETAVSVVRRVDRLIAQTFDAENFVRVERSDAPARLRREVARAKAFIEARHTEAISTTTIAEHAGLSPSALSRAFRKELGVTPPEYLRAVRVARFEHLLVESDMSIREAARLAGMSSTGHLREHITGKYGMSPRELRDRLRQSS